jgi:septal ring factor EnvC (AmiA/AmiB activator)
MGCSRWIWAGGGVSVAIILGAGLLAAPEPACGQTQESLDKRIKSQQSELDRIKQQIKEHRQRSSELKKQKSSVLKKLSSLDKEIDLSSTLLKNLARQEALLAERIDSLRVQISAEEDALEKRKAVLGKRLRQMYKRDPDYRWDVLLGGGSIQQSIRRYKFATLMAEHDAALIAEVRSRKLAYQRESAALTESLADMVVVRNSREEEAEQLEKNRGQRRVMLGQIRNEEAKHQKAIKNLENTQEEVKDLIGQLEKKRLELERQGLVAAGEFAKLKGKLIRPVEGRILRGFGKIKHPTYGTVTFNRGVDIGAAAGTPIRAVAPGVVEFVDWIDAYGKCIILNHGGGYYTLYGHVATTFVANGQKVEYGKVIAEVGDTGSLEGYECHFEIRHSKQALNPMEWFAKQ